MKFQSVDIEGILNVQRVSTLPAWNIQTDVGRFLFVRNENNFYLGKADGWERWVSNGLNPVLVIENYNAREQDLCLIDTRNGPITITLPPAPKMGAQIMFVDVAGTFETNQVTVSANGKRIQRLNKDLILDINDFSGSLVYDPLTSSWKVSIEGVAQLVGNTTLFVHKTTIIADNINGTGCQQQFNVPWIYNPQLDNISVTVQGVQQYHFEKTNQSSITLAEPVPAGTEVQICSIPLEGSFDIEHFVSLDHLEKNYISAKNLWQWILDHDGAKSGLDADKLQGIDGSRFLQIKDLLKEIQKIDGPGSGIDADLLDGFGTAQVGPLPNKVVVTGEDGYIDKKFLPFGRGGIELVRVLEIPKGASAIDLTNLDIDTGYLVKGWNICPTTDDVRLSVAVYNETDKTWKDGFEYWTCSYTTATSSGLRDFNSDSDMTIAKHVKSVEGGVNFELWIDGFHGMSNPTVSYKAKTVRSSASFLGSNSNCASLFQSVGVLPKHWDIYSALRLYFAPEGSSNVSLIEEGGKICVYRWIDEFDATHETPDYSRLQITVVEGHMNLDQLSYNNSAVSTHFPEAIVENKAITVEMLAELAKTDRSRQYPTFEIRDTHYTVASFLGTRDRALDVVEGTLNVAGLITNSQATSKSWADLSIFAKTYNVTDLESVLKYDRTTDSIPEFNLIDGHYTVTSLGGTESDAARFSVEIGPLNSSELIEQETIQPEIVFGDLTVENRAYQVAGIERLLSKDWSTQLPEANLIDNHFTVESLLKALSIPRVAVKKSSMDVPAVQKNNEARSLAFEDFSVMPVTYNVNSLENLISRNWSNSFPEFTLIDGSYTVERLNNDGTTDEFTLIVENGTYTVQAVNRNNAATSASNSLVTVHPDSYTISSLIKLLSKDWSTDNIDGAKLVDGTYTIKSLTGEAQVVVENGQISISNLSSVQSNVISEDFEVRGRSYSADELNTLNKLDRNVTTTNFVLVDGTYNVKTVNGDAQIIVRNGQISIVNVPSLNNSVITDEFEVKGRQYSANELAKLLGIDRNTTTPEFALVDGTYLVTTVDGQEAKLTVKNGTYTLTAVKRNSQSSETNFGDATVASSTYTVASLTKLLDQDYSQSLSEVQIKDNSMTINDFGK